MIKSERRYDIDWLRVIAIGLLLVYHVVIGFQPWGVFIGFLQSNEPIEPLWVPMSMLNVWRIPLLFFVSGMGVCFAIARRDWKALITERTRRILVPFLFGMAAIVPLHVFLWQDYYSQDIEYVFHPYHLWFLGNIFIYVLVLSPVFFYLKRNPEGKVKQALKKLYSTPLGLVLVIAPFVLEAILLRPESFETYAMTLHGFLLGLLAFFFGFSFVYAGDSFWNTIVKWRFMLLFLALALYMVRLLAFELQGPHYLTAIESCLWVFSVFAFGRKHLNKNSPSLRYLSEAAYPVYIIHMFFLYLGSWIIFPTEIPVILQFLFVVAFTGLGCMLTYEFVIRKVNFLRPLFGLKPKSKAKPDENKVLKVIS